MSTWEDKNTRVHSLPSEDTVRRQLSASQEEVLHQNLTSWDFPGGPVVKNPPASAGDTGSIPGPGRSHMSMGQVSLCTQLTEPVF